MRKEIGKKIKVAILAEEPVGWGSGKHYFPIILDKKCKYYYFYDGKKLLIVVNPTVNRVYLYKYNQ